MSAHGPGPFENDGALDLCEELQELDVEAAHDLIAETLTSLAEGDEESTALPAPPSLTYADPGNAPPHPGTSPRPASAEGFGTYAAKPATQGPGKVVM